MVGRARDAARIVVEAAGERVDERLAALPGVAGVEREESIDGRVRVALTSSSGEDLRPRIFELAKSAGWTLYELHHEAANLEDLFRELTAEPGGEP
jgi:hypothetical protein